MFEVFEDSVVRILTQEWLTVTMIVASILILLYMGITVEE